MRLNLSQTGFATKLSEFKCLTNIIIQATVVGSGTQVRIDHDKQGLENNVIPKIGLVINPDSGLYTFCWIGELWVISDDGPMAIDWVANSE